MTGACLFFFNMKHWKHLFLQLTHFIIIIWRICNLSSVLNQCFPLFFFLSSSSSSSSSSSNKTRIPVYIAHTPAGTSVKNMVHFAQVYMKHYFEFNENITVIWLGLMYREGCVFPVRIILYKIVVLGIRRYFTHHCLCCEVIVCIVHWLMVEEVSPKTTPTKTNSRQDENAFL